MGKRSDFERVERDFYPTPLAAIQPLVPHLPKGEFTFADTSFGTGDLAHGVELLTEGRGTCTFKSDIEDRHPDSWQKDMFDVTRGHLDGVTMGIFNTPWDRGIFHRAIEHFRQILPCWFLIDADWMHTIQSEEIILGCRKIVSVGRVKWMPGSKHTGKDNCQWMLFDRGEYDFIQFVGRKKFPKIDIESLKPAPSAPEADETIDIEEYIAKKA